MELSASLFCGSTKMALPRLNDSLTEKGVVMQYDHSRKGNSYYPVERADKGGVSLTKIYSISI